MTTVTRQKISKTLTARIRKISEGNHDLFEQDRRSVEQSCFHAHCKRIWQQLTTEERNVIRDSLRKEGTLFHESSRSDHRLEACCIAHVKEIIQKSSHFS